MNYQLQELQSIYKWAWIVLVVLAVFLGVKTLDGLRGLREDIPAYNTITVSGDGEAFAVPDIATFSFAVSADAKTVKEAQDKVKQDMNSVLAAMNSLGIEEKDVKTLDYSVYPKYSYTSQPCLPSYCPPSKQIQEGYTANHTVSVKVIDTEMAGDALSLAGERGASNLSSVSFTIDDPEVLIGQAREAAIAEAKNRAEVLAQDLGVRLGRIISFSDSSNNGPTLLYREALGMGGDAGATNALTIPTGENKVEVLVNITYEMR